MPPKLAFTLSVQEPRPARTTTVEGRALKIGRSPRADVTVDDPTVSPLHAAIEASSTEELTIVDLESDNGTLVNGERITRAKISPGDHIQIGTTQIVLLNADPVLGDTASYRAAPVVESDLAPLLGAPRGVPASAGRLQPIETTGARLRRTVSGGGLWIVEHLPRWWPIATGVVLGGLYLAFHRLSLPAQAELGADGLIIGWPMPRLLLLSGILGSLLALGDSLLRDPIGDRTVAGRVLLLLAAVVSLPLVLQMAMATLPVIGSLAGAIVVGGMVIYGLYSLGRWVVRGSD